MKYVLASIYLILLLIMINSEPVANTGSEHKLKTLNIVCATSKFSTNLKVSVSLDFAHTIPIMSIKREVPNPTSPLAANHYQTSSGFAIVKTGSDTYGQYTIYNLNDVFISERQGIYSLSRHPHNPYGYHQNTIFCK